MNEQPVSISEQVEHSKVVGGSTANRVLECPASVKALQALGPVDDSNPYAEEGTALHDALAFFLDGDHEIEDIEGLAGMVFNRHEIDGRLMFDFLMPAMEGFDHYCKLFKHEGGLAFLVEVKTEIALPDELAQLAGDTHVFGTSDIIGRTDRRTIVWDWKMGRGPVSPDRNDQMFFYATAALETMPDMFEQDDDWPVEFFICQPPLYEPGEIPVKRWSTTVSALREWKQDLFDALENAFSEAPDRVRGDHCRFAACKTTCPLHTAPLAQLTGLQGEIEESGVEDVTQPAEAPGVDDWVGDRLGRMLDLFDIIEPLMNAARAQALSRLENGLPVTGYKIVPKRAMRKWTDEEEAVKVLRSCGLKKGDMYIEKLVSPAQAEAAMKRLKIKLDDKKAARFKSASPAVSSGGSLAPWDDPRPEIESTVAGMQKLVAKLQDE